MQTMQALARIPKTPVKLWEDGTIRVGTSHVRIDLVVQHFKKGHTAKEIQHRFPSLAMRDVYGAIIYYMEHIEGIEAYLEEQQERLAEENG